MTYYAEMRVPPDPNRKQGEVKSYIMSSEELAKYGYVKPEKVPVGVNLPKGRGGRKRKKC